MGNPHKKQKLHFNYKLKSTSRVIEIMSSYRTNYIHTVQ